MTDTEKNCTANRSSSKPFNLQLPIDPDQATEFMGWLRQVVEAAVAASLAGQKKEPGTQPADLNGPRLAPEVKAKGIDVSDRAKAKAADLRIDMLLGKIPDSPGILIDATTTAKLLGISRSTFFKLLSMEAVPEPALIGGKIGRWRLAELLEWIDGGCPPRRFWNYKGQGNSKRRAGR